ncbi:helix-turn-helix domain-containing protein [Rhodobacteraceae bacterium M382]|nr:helix-turn-helix domain-containing protein [Rhodobacteraceae bacterium M382]
MSEDVIDWYGPDMATFGDRVAAAREAADMTQAQMARRLGVKKATVIGWEQDLSEPRANKLSMLSGLLNVSMRWLLTGEGDDMLVPAEADAPQDFSEVLRELRSMRENMRQQAERAALLEKKLRKLVESGAQ